MSSKVLKLIERRRSLGNKLIQTQRDKVFAEIEKDKEKYIKCMLLEERITDELADINIQLRNEADRVMIVESWD